jgi:redox-sensitive bicupin YhaK (pirin superfamily)
VGGFTVARLLPHPARRLVGPFVFFDHIGPVDFPPGAGMDVRAHPHIGLSTVTYLFDGAIGHRDSLGTDIVVRPGAVNWMTAGRGITHTERTPPAERAAGHRLHGIQSWVALPTAHEEDAPAFTHHPADSLPRVAIPGGDAVVIAGTLFGATSPVHFPHPIFYAELRLEAGARIDLPAAMGERAVCLVSGAATLGGNPVPEGGLLVAEDGADAVLETDAASHLMLLGGAPMDGPRHMWWNLVSSDPARIEEAKTEWAGEAWRRDPAEGRFRTVPGDDTEWIPLPAQ